MTVACLTIGETVMQRMKQPTLALFLIFAFIAIILGLLSAGVCCLLVPQIAQIACCDKQTGDPSVNNQGSASNAQGQFQGAAALTFFCTLFLTIATINRRRAIPTSTDPAVDRRILHVLYVALGWCAFALLGAIIGLGTLALRDLAWFHILLSNLLLRIVSLGCAALQVALERRPRAPSRRQTIQPGQIQLPKLRWSALAC